MPVAGRWLYLVEVIHQDGEVLDHRAVPIAREQVGRQHIRRLHQEPFKAGEFKEIPKPYDKPRGPRSELEKAILEDAVEQWRKRFLAEDKDNG